MTNENSLTSTGLAKISGPPPALPPLAPKAKSHHPRATVAGSNVYAAGKSRENRASMLNSSMNQQQHPRGIPRYRVTDEAWEKVFDLLMEHSLIEVPEDYF